MFFFWGCIPLALLKRGSFKTNIRHCRNNILCPVATAWEISILRGDDFWHGFPLARCVDIIFALFQTILHCNFHLRYFSRGHSNVYWGGHKSSWISHREHAAECVSRVRSIKFVIRWMHARLVEPVECWKAGSTRAHVRRNTCTLSLPTRLHLIRFVPTSHLHFIEFLFGALSSNMSGFIS